MDEIGTIVTIGSEQFYTIGIEGDNVKLLSMMNITLDDNPIQSFNAGTTAFSSDEKKGINYSDYNGSIVEEYVNSYKNKLEEKFEINIAEARLITKDELISLGCVRSSCSCRSNAPSWVYSTSYWSGSAHMTSFVWNVYSDGVFDFRGYASASGAGVRPVIIISKSNF